MDVSRHKNRNDKCSAEEMLPSRFSRDTITGQAPHLRAFNDYSKSSQKQHEAASETFQMPSHPNVLVSFD